MQRRGRARLLLSQTHGHDGIVSVAAVAGVSNTSASLVVLVRSLAPVLVGTVPVMHGNTIAGVGMGINTSSPGTLSHQIGWGDMVALPASADLPHADRGEIDIF